LNTTSLLAGEEDREHDGAPDEDFTAAELIAYLADCESSEREDEAWAWLDAQLDPAEAARLVLMAGASLEPRLRWIAADVADLLDEEALPVWREMTDVPGMAAHAKFRPLHRGGRSRAGRRRVALAGRRVRRSGAGGQGTG
jgi:hypothetical protein